MKIALFDAHHFEIKIFEKINLKFNHELTYFETRLTPETAKLAKNFSVICSFAHDCLNETTLKILKQEGIQLIALRSAGFNHVNLPIAQQLGLKIVRVPAYSPNAVAEHAVAL